MRQPILFALIFLAFVSASCSRIDREEIELLKKDDPEFATMMAIKSGATHEIGELKSQLSQTKNTFSKKKSELEASYGQEAARIGGQIRVLETKIETLRDRIKAEIAELTGSVALQKKTAIELDAALGDLNDVLARKGTLDLSSKESREWEERRKSITEKIASLRSEIATQESAIAIKRKKLKYL